MMCMKGGEGLLWLLLLLDDNKTTRGRDTAPSKTPIGGGQLTGRPNASASVRHPTTMSHGAASASQTTPAAAPALLPNTTAAPAAAPAAAGRLGARAFASRRSQSSRQRHPTRSRPFPIPFAASSSNGEPTAATHRPPAAAGRCWSRSQTMLLLRLAAAAAVPLADAPASPTACPVVFAWPHASQDASERQTDTPRRHPFLGALLGVLGLWTEDQAAG